MLDDRNLARQLLFWLAIFIPISLFFIFGIPVWKNYNFAFSTFAYDNFLKTNKLPLYLLGTCVPLVAIIVYMHRTIQTEKQIKYSQDQLESTKIQLKNTLKQIELTDRKNKADLYYSHVKFIIDAFASLPTTTISYGFGSVPLGKEDFRLAQPHALYKKIFHKSNISDGYSSEVNPEIAKVIEYYFKNIGEALSIKDEVTDSDEKRLKDLLLIDKQISHICATLCLEYNPSNHLFYVHGEHEKFKISFSSEEKIKSTLKHLYKVALQISDTTGMRSDYLSSLQTKGNINEVIIYFSSPQMSFRGFLPSGVVAVNREFMGQVQTIDGDNVATQQLK